MITSGIHESYGVPTVPMHPIAWSLIGRDRAGNWASGVGQDLCLLRNETLESTIIVDNSPMAYMFQPENAIDCIRHVSSEC